MRNLSKNAMTNFYFCDAISSYHLLYGNALKDFSIHHSVIVLFSDVRNMPLGNINSIQRITKSSLKVNR